MSRCARRRGRPRAAGGAGAFPAEQVAAPRGVPGEQRAVLDQQAEVPVRVSGQAHEPGVTVAERVGGGHPTAASGPAACGPKRRVGTTWSRSTGPRAAVRAAGRQSTAVRATLRRDGLGDQHPAAWDPRRAPDVVGVQVRQDDVRDGVRVDGVGERAAHRDHGREQASVRPPAAPVRPRQGRVPGVEQHRTVRAGPGEHVRGEHPAAARGNPEETAHVVGRPPARGGTQDTERGAPPRGRPPDAQPRGGPPDARSCGCPAVA